nr:MAG TPA: hypothetical protein [Caudoviricetes sp.]
MPKSPKRQMFIYIKSRPVLEHRTANRKDPTLMRL